MARSEEYTATCGGGACEAVLVGGSEDAFVDQLTDHARRVHGVTDEEKLAEIARTGRENAQAQRAGNG